MGLTINRLRDDKREADVTTEAKTWTKTSLSTKPASETAQDDRREMIEIAQACRDANKHNGFFSGFCTTCGTPPKPHLECVKHGPFISRVCERCGQADNPPIKLPEAG